LRIHTSWRVWLRVFLAVVLLVVVWMRFGPQRHTKTAVGKPVTDLAATSPLNQPGDSPAPPEAYEIYSALYQAPIKDALAFAENSVTDIPQVDGSCLKPSTPQEKEMADAFVAANRQSHRWQQKFSIPQGYRVLPRDQLAQAQSCLATHGRDAAACNDYSQVRYVRYLGVPGFDHSRTRALVSVIKSCGGFCGSGGIFAVEKSGATWRRSPTTDFTRNCSWMY